MALPTRLRMAVVSRSASPNTWTPGDRDDTISMARDSATAAIDQSRLVAASRAIEIVSSLSPGVQVFGDADLLATAIRNLVGNAIHYSDPGTRVAVSVRSEEGLVEIAVSDQGHGIHKSEQARIFERFY